MSLNGSLYMLPAPSNVYLPEESTCTTQWRDLPIDSGILGFGIVGWCGCWLGACMAWGVVVGRCGVPVRMRFPSIFSSASLTPVCHIRSQWPSFANCPCRESETTIGDGDDFMVTGSSGFSLGADTVTPCWVLISNSPDQSYTVGRVDRTVPSDETHSLCAISC